MSFRVDTEKCDGCRRCIKECIYDAIVLKDGHADIGQRCTHCGACLKVCPGEAVQSDIQPKTIPDFSDRKDVWTFAEHRNGRISPVVFELLGKAKELANASGQKTAAALLGWRQSDLAETLIRHGADIVYYAEDESLKSYDTTAYASALAQLITAYKPDILLIGASHTGRDLAPRVARRVGSGLTADCTDLSIDPDEKILFQTRPAFGGSIMATIVSRYSRPQMATVRPGVTEIRFDPENKGEIIRCDAAIRKDAGVELLERIPITRTGCDIGSAKIIVAGGRGVGGAEGFAVLRELADVMGGEVAGTRVAVEEGWIPPENQVGQTGRTVRPDIYIACGISGAVQHRAGIMASRYIIAINKDSKAPIFQIADWGIVGDLHQIVPEMIRQLKEKSENR